MEIPPYHWTEMFNQEYYVSLKYICYIDFQVYVIL